ncbi:MAG: 5-formyltetrahydrofolate cyclo-ligase [Gammaproteobacteria bacterium]|nr:5-formyltetrahydrofolate cyclo-ligase [Gammaproteobacteria bacterium]
MNQQLRQQIRNQRRSLSVDQRRELSTQLVQHLAHSKVFQKSRHIAFYLPNDGEIDLQSLIKIAWRHKKYCYLPVLGLKHGRALWFLPYTPGTRLYKNRFGIKEPVHSRHQRLFKTQSLDLILMPLVAFDHEGNRMGMGGGYYDRTLAYLQQRKIWHKPHRIGTAYEFQRVEKLTSRSWDIPIEGVVTEKMLQIF